jgi:subtilase family serine protease
MIRARAFVLCLLSVAACGASDVDGVDDASGDDDSKADGPGDDPTALSRRVCPPPSGPGLASCHARVRITADGIVDYSARPSGFGPAELQSAYDVDPTRGAIATIAIVDAQDDPHAEEDLAVYRRAFALEPCTTANKCFRKVNQSGHTSPLPAADPGWSSEIMLDLEMASAVCPRCKLLLVEASSPSMADLGAAVDTAVALGASVVSNSYGGPEVQGELSADAHYHHPGVQIFVSAGDSGYAVEYPASSPYVTAVGGTILKKSSTARGWSERVWGTASSMSGGTGSGCSVFEPKPSWQRDARCAFRTVADLAAVADPATGVAVYDTVGGNGWAVFGGTSAAAPIVAGIMASTGHAADDASMIYAHPSAFHDVTSGTNGSCGSYLCAAGRGYDGPTGLGTPSGGALAGL